MSETAHKDAAEHHERATKAHRRAAEHHANGKHDEARKLAADAHALSSRAHEMSAEAMADRAVAERFILDSTAQRLPPGRDKRRRRQHLPASRSSLLTHPASPRQ